MAINPLQRFTNFDVPVFPQGAGVRVDPSTWSNLASVGESIAAVREKSEMAEIMRSATDASGNLDMNKLATAVAVSGRDPTKILNAISARISAEKGGAATDIAQKQYDLAREKWEAGETTVRPPTMLDPGGFYTMKPGKPVFFTPFPPQQPAPAPIAPGGGASVVPPAGGPTMASAGPPTPPLSMSSLPPEPAMPVRPGAAPSAPRMAAAQLPLPFDPEEGAPYRVAGEPVAAPKPAAPPRNDAFLRTLPTEAARTIVKGLAEYELDPSSFQGKERDELLAAAKMYRPDYKQSEYVKRQAPPPSAEVQARVGLGRNFLDQSEKIEAFIRSDVLNTASGRLQAHFGQGLPAEVSNMIANGAEALLRNLTGAGMSQSEASDYVKRFRFATIDLKDTQLRKLRGLDEALRYVVTEVQAGRSGENMLKGFRSKFGEDPLADEKKTAPPKVKSDAEVNTLINQANEMLSQAQSPEARAKALPRVHKRLEERGVPPQFWPR